MGLFSKKEVERKATWFFSDEAIKRFNSFKGTELIVLDAFKENFEDVGFALAFEYLSKGRTDYLKNRASKYSVLEGDNVLKFLSEYIGACLKEEKLDNYFASFRAKDYYYLLTILGCGILDYEPEPEDEVDYTFPNCLKMENNQVLHIMLAINKAHAKNLRTLTFSSSTYDAIMDLVEMVKKNMYSRMDKKEPEIFNPDFYDISDAEAFINKVQRVIQRY